MLRRVAVNDIDDLYADVPAEFIHSGDYDLPDAMSEQQVRDFFEGLAALNPRLKVYVGQGAYDHYTPAVIPYITSRSEFLTAYTPYQCEISQGTLRYIFEWQTMICNLTGLDVANASMYDGATAAAEAMRMCVASARKRGTVVVSSLLLGNVLETIRTYAAFAAINVVEAEDVAKAAMENAHDLAGVIVPSIDRYGTVADHSGLADTVHSCGALLAMYCDPSALAVLRTPSQWGADIAVGDGQSLGIPLCYGGPYVGFIACTEPLMRKLPGRIVGQSTDASGKRCFVLTLQAREQHIRREKATSNICSNESLMALWCTVYLSIMGSEGLRRVNDLCCANAHLLHDGLMATGLFEDPFEGRPFLKEFCLKPLFETSLLEKALLAKGIFSALPTSEGYVSFCCTEKASRQDIDTIISTAKEIGEGLK